MGKSKLKRFRENFDSGVVIEQGTPLFDSICGRWQEIFFKNNNPITVELACGRGEYTTGLAEIFGQRNFIGVDIKGSRIWKGMCAIKERNLLNAAFLRTQIDHLERFFNQDEVDEIWITFPDPRPKSSDEKRRLTAPRYLEIYRKILKKNGIVHLKTDNTGLFSYTLDVLKNLNGVNDLVYTYDLYASNFLALHYGITTRYEREFMDRGEKIKYLNFRF